MTLCVQHFRMSAAAAAVHTWVAKALERRRLGGLLRAAATQALLGLAARVLTAWVAWFAHRRQRKRLLVSFFLSAKLRLSRLAFNAWAEQVVARRRLVAVGARIGLVSRAARLRTAVRLWLRDGDEQRVKQAKLRRSLGLLRNRLLAMAWQPRHV